MIEESTLKPAWSALRVGDVAQIQHTITSDDIDAFAKLSGDYNSIHLNDQAAADRGLNQRVAHGMLTASFLSTLIGQKLPGDGALWYEQSLQFIEPVYIGDTLSIVATIKQKSEVERILLLDTVIYKSSNIAVLTGEAKVKILENQNNSAVGLNKGAIIISGATGDIGTAIAKSLAIAGFPIILHYFNNSNKANALHTELSEASLQTMIYQADIASETEVASMVDVAIKHFGSVYGYIHCAAPALTQKNFEDIEWLDIQKQIEIQLKGCFNLSKFITPHLKKAGSGSIIHLLSSVIDTNPPHQWLPYVSAKGALEQYTRSLAIELGPHHIRVNAISPGLIHSKMTAHLSERAKLVIKAHTPLAQIGTCEDIADAAAFLMSDRAKHIHGETLRVNGGYSMH